MAEVDSLDIRISASSTEAAAAIGNLANKLNELKTALKGGVSGAQFKNLAKSLEELGTAAKNVEGSIGALAKAAKAVERLSSIGKVRIPKSLSDGIRNVGLAAEMVTPEAVANLDSMTRSLQRLANVDLKGVSSALRAVSATGGEGAGVLPTVDRSTKGMSPFGALVGSEWKSLKEGRFKLNIDTSALKKVGDLARSALRYLRALGQRIRVRIEAATVDKLKAKLGVVSTIFRSLGRIAFYRAIRSAIKAVTEAFRVGLEWAKKYSDTLTDAVDRRISTAMDGLNVSANKMKLQLGAAFGSLITALAPVINTLIGLITSLATALTQLFAAFTGGTFLKAKDVSGDLAKNMKAGGGAAKEWKNQLMGFDEINRLEDQNGGGGGGGGGALNASDMFEVVEVDQAIQDFVDSIKTAFENGDWEGLGTLLGNKINEIFDSIDWEKVGEKIGYYINGLIETMYNFLKTIDFVQIGKNIAILINNALGKINFEDLGRLLVRKITAAFDTLIGFIYKFDAGQLGSAIYTFLRGAISEATEWLGQYNWYNIGFTIRSKLTSLFENLRAGELAIALSDFLKKAWNAATLLFAGFGIDISYISWDTSKLDPEKTAQNLIVKLSAVLGMATGFMFGGVPGAVVGTLLGCTISTFINDMLFNNDGVINSNELGEMLRGALFLLCGGAIGFALNGPGGAILGATISLGVWAALTALEPQEPEEGAGGTSFLDKLTTAMTTFTGLGIGFKLGGPGGALIGAAISFGIDYFIRGFLLKDTSGWNTGTWIANIVGALAPAAGVIVGLAVGGPVGAAIGAIIGFGISFDIQELLQTDKTGWTSDTWVAKIVDALAPAAGAIIGLIAGGPFGAAVGATIGLGIKWAISTNFEGAQAAFQAFGEFCIGVINSIKQAFNGLFTADTSGTLTWGTSGRGYAQGGFVQTGELFLAREAGPELVGTMGGHTAVANNDQIVEGISQGVYGAVLAAMSNSGGGNNQPITIYLDGREIARSTTKYQNQMARAGAY